MDDIMKTVFRDAVDYIGRLISERGIQGEGLLAKHGAYEILFTSMKKSLFTDFKVREGALKSVIHSRFWTPGSRPLPASG
jgi:hypothetical protein